MKKTYFRKIIKFVTVCLCCSLCFCLAAIMGIPSAGTAEIVDRIVAQVNDDIITLQDLEKALVPYEEKIRGGGYAHEKAQQLLYKAREDVLNELIGNKLTEQEARDEGITIKENEIDAAVENVKGMNFFTQEQLVEALANDGMTLEAFRQNIREQMLRTRLVSLKVKSKIVITKEDIKKYYDKHPEKYAGKKQYHLRSIIKRVPEFSDENAIQGIIDDMQSIIARLNQGEDFKSLARENSDYLAEDEGDLGLFTLDELSPNIKSAIKDLHAGEHTEVVNTDQGFQIFYVEEVLEKAGKPVEDVSVEIQEVLYKEVINEKFAEFVGGLKEKAHIKIIR